MPWIYEVLDRNLAQVVLAISHKDESKGLKLVEEHGGRALLLPFRRGDDDRATYMRGIKKILVKAEPNIVLTLGWDLILPPFLVEELDDLDIPTINLHPALVSADGRPIKTKYGPVPVIRGEVEKVVREAIQQKLKATGASLHLIPRTAEVDEGRVILQKVIPVREGDDAGSLETRVHEAEKEIIQKLILRIQKDELI